MSDGNGHGWPLWRRQITVLARQEIGRSLFSKRSLAVYLLAAGLAQPYDGGPRPVWCD